MFYQVRKNKLETATIWLYVKKRMTVFDISYSDRFSGVDPSPECVFDVVITLLSITLPASSNPSGFRQVFHMAFKMWMGIFLSQFSEDQLFPFSSNSCSLEQIVVFVKKKAFHRAFLQFTCSPQVYLKVCSAQTWPEHLANLISSLWEDVRSAIKDHNKTTHAIECCRSSYVCYEFNKHPKEYNK